MKDPKDISGREVVDHLVDFLEGNLTPEMTQCVRKKLESSEATRRFVESYKKTISLCEKSLQTQAPADFAEKLAKFLKEQAENSDSSS